MKHMHRSVLGVDVRLTVAECVSTMIGNYTNTNVCSGVCASGSDASYLMELRFQIVMCASFYHTLLLRRYLDRASK